MLDGDNVFLAAQEEELRARGTAAADCSKTYYMPTSLDHAVAAFRTWFNNHADALPWGPAAKPPPAPATCSRLELLNRYEQHTQHCPSCSAVHTSAPSRAFLGMFPGCLQYWCCRNALMFCYSC